MTSYLAAAIIFLPLSLGTLQRSWFFICRLAVDSLAATTDGGHISVLRGLGRERIGIRCGLGEALTSRVADPTLLGLIGVNPPPSAVGLPAARVADPTLLGLICVNPPPPAVGLPAARV